MEKTAVDTDVRLAQIVDAVHNSGAGSTRDSIVVRFTHTADSRDGRVSLEQVMLSEVCGSPVTEISSQDMGQGLVPQVALYSPDTPFSVKTRSGLNSIILSHIALICSSSISKILFQSASF